MSEPVIGKAVRSDTCENVSIVNELNIPVLCMGVKDLIVSASPEGILVSDREQSSYIKPYVDRLEPGVKFAEKSWGSFVIIDEEEESLTIKVTLNPGHAMNYHSHERRDEVWTVIGGTGRAVVDGAERLLKPGDSLKLPAGCRHRVSAETELTLIEVQTGLIDVHDKKKYTGRQ